MFNISFFIYFCSYDATIAELLVPNKPVNTDYLQINPDWFKRFGWLYYGISRDTVFCFVCIKALSKGPIFTGKVESAFVETAFRNWEKALEKNRGLLKHQQFSANNNAVQRYVNAPVENHDVDEMASNNIT